MYQVYSLEKSDKSKTGNDGFVQKRDFMNETHWIFIGRLPVMVKSDLCLLHSHKESDCLFDAGGYFLVKGMEKVNSDLCLAFHFLLTHENQSIAGLAGNVSTSQKVWYSPPGVHLLPLS